MNSTKFIPWKIFLPKKKIHVYQDCIWMSFIPKMTWCFPCFAGAGITHITKPQISFIVHFSWRNVSHPKWCGRTFNNKKQFKEGKKYLLRLLRTSIGMSAVPCKFLFAQSQFTLPYLSVVICHTRHIKVHIIWYQLIAFLFFISASFNKHFALMWLTSIIIACYACMGDICL